MAPQFFFFGGGLTWPELPIDFQTVNTLVLSKMQNRGSLILFGTLIAVAVLGASYVFLMGSDISSKSPAPTSFGSAQDQRASASPSASATADSTGEVLELEVSGKEFALDPGKITINEGEKVKLTFKNEGTMPHDLVIDELGVRTKVIGGGQIDTVEFVASKGGSFKIYCSVGNHRVRGMEGDVEIK